MRVNRYFICVFVTLMILIISRFSTSEGLSQNCSVLYLLNVEPYPYPYGKTTVTVWDKGLDVIPAGHLATEQINNHSDILQSYRLELIDVDSEPCGLNSITKGVINVYRELVDQDKASCIVGVIGLLCSPVTNVISPIVSHPKIGGFVQIASSTSPIHRANPKKSNVFHIIGSSSVFNEAVFALMHNFDWQRISIVYNSVRFYQRSVAEDFIERVQNVSDVELVTQAPLTSSLSTIPEAFDILNENEARISYWTVDYKLVSHMLCEAYRKKFLWPGYVYIIAEPKLDKVLDMKTSCTKKEIMTALEGVFLLDYRLFVDNNTNLFSGLTFGEYKEKYIDKLMEFASSRTDYDFKENDYGNSLYDQVWAFALALNKSFKTSQDLPSESYKGGDMNSNLTTALKRELKKLSFQGASGRIQFGEKQESPSYISISQIRNGMIKPIGIYDPFTHNITFEYFPTDIPRDTFETVYIRLPNWLGGCILLAQGVLFCLTTTNLVLMVLWRKEREIKATSPILSSLMIIGCYFLCAGPVLQVFYTRFVTDSLDLIRSLCVLKNWTTVGAELIFATLFLRLLRIYRIFCTSPMAIMSKYWVNKYLLIYALLICLGKVIPLILWSTIDPIHPVSSPTYVYDSTQGVPHYVSTIRCICKRMPSTLWLVLTQLYSGILLLVVVFLAFRTRRVKKAVYKDTKKVNIFIFLVVVVLLITISVWVIFLEIGIEVGEHVADWLSWYTIPMLCQICLFVPKTLPVFIRKVKQKPRLS